VAKKVGRPYEVDILKVHKYLAFVDIAIVTKEKSNRLLKNKSSTSQELMAAADKATAA
jgi:hypothetical protein